MKKNIFKKFHFMAMLASLTLICWGGVTACCNGSDDDGGVTIKLKGAFFEEGDENTPWVYCTEELKEKTESGIWEGEITSVNSNGWDNFGLEINGTWYGAEESLSGNNYTDAKLVKNSSTNFWLVTDKGGKTKVTVNLNTMTITAVDASQTTDTTPPTTDDDDDTTPPGKDDNETPSDDEEAEEFSSNYEASKISKTATSITVTVTDITSTTNDEWKFWAATSDSASDEIKYKSGEGAACIYELIITDATKIAYVKEKGIAIKGTKGITATVTVTTTEPDEDDGDDADTDNKILVDNYAYTADGNLIEVCSASKFAGISPKSITVSIANVEKNDADGDWWASYYNGESAWVPMQDDWDDSIKGYKKTITDSSTISYFKENGIKIGMLSGLTAKITVTYE